MTQHMTPAEYHKQIPKVGGRRVTPETALKAAVKEWLSYHGWSHWPNTQGMGSYPGIPDRTAIKDGRVVFIEVKVPGRNLSEAQEAFKDMIGARGGVFLTVRDIDDLEALWRDRRRQAA